MDKMQCNFQKVLYCVACIHPQKREADNIIVMSITHVKVEGLVMLLI